MQSCGIFTLNYFNTILLSNISFTYCNFPYSSSLTGSSHSLEPFSLGILYCQMRKPFIRCSTMPVFNTCRNINAVTWLHFYSFVAFLLIISSSGNAYQNLSSATFRMMNMPVISASRFECHIENSNLRSGDRCKKLLPEKYCAKPSFGAPIGNTISFACARIASSLYGKSPSPASHTSFARLKTAHAFGQPA